MLSLTAFAALLSVLKSVYIEYSDDIEIPAAVSIGLPSFDSMIVVSRGEFPGDVSSLFGITLSVKWSWSFEELSKNVLNVYVTYNRSADSFKFAHSKTAQI